jgi:hypothetical protein
MKVTISERQLKMIVQNTKKNLIEQETAPSPEPESGTSDVQSGGQGYPEVGKWESGVTRGPSNQIGVTKWSDVVGQSLKRDKANMLK